RDIVHCLCLIAGHPYYTPQSAETFINREERYRREGIERVIDDALERAEKLVSNPLNLSLPLKTME
ncbi:hypothetical protein ADUPG1_013985, partial [Aduncisulcus paluster]